MVSADATSGSTAENPCPSCLFSSMSWVSSSTTACATTLVARAARGRGSRAGGARIIDVLKSPEHAPRNICLRRHAVNTEIVECFEYWVVERHCRQLLKVVITGGVRNRPQDPGARWSR